MKRDLKQHAYHNYMYSNQHADLACGYKTFFMFMSVEHEILDAHKYKKYSEIWLFLGSDKPRVLFSHS